MYLYCEKRRGEPERETPEHPRRVHRSAGGPSALLPFFYTTQSRNVFRTSNGSVLTRLCSPSTARLLSRPSVPISETPFPRVSDTSQRIFPNLSRTRLRVPTGSSPRDAFDFESQLRSIDRCGPSFLHSSPLLRSIQSAVSVAHSPEMLAHPSTPTRPEDRRPPLPFEECTQSRTGSSCPPAAPSSTEIDSPCCRASTCFASLAEFR